MAKELSQDDMSKIAKSLGAIQATVIFITNGGDKEQVDCNELMLSVVGNRAALTSGDARQFIEATIRWCGERLGMQVEYPHRQRTWLDGENDGVRP